MKSDLTGVPIAPLSKSELLAYCFGFFDGEGNISIRKNNKTYSVLIRAFQKERLPLEILKSIFGGRISVDKVCGIRIMYRWELSKRTKMERFLKYGMRYLFCKKAEADYALNLLKITKVIGPRPRSIDGTFSPLTSAQIAEQKVWYDLCRDAKRRKSVFYNDDGQAELAVNYKIVGLR